MNYIPERDELGNPITLVKTKFEDEDIILKLIKLRGQADVNGDLAISIIVPGTFPDTGRYAAGVWCFTDNYHWDDCLNKIEIIDYLGLVAPVDTVLETYHENEMSADEEGWWFWKSHGSEGECEVPPIGYYGQIKGQLELRLTFKVRPNAKVKVNGWWGKKSV